MKKLTILIAMLMSMGAWGLNINFKDNSMFAEQTFSFSNSSFGADISISFTDNPFSADVSIYLTNSCFLADVSEGGIGTNIAISNDSYLSDTTIHISESSFGATSIYITDNSFVADKTFCLESNTYEDRKKIAIMYFLNK